MGGDTAGVGLGLPVGHGTSCVSKAGASTHATVMLQLVFSFAQARCVVLDVFFDVALQLYNEKRGYHEERIDGSLNSTLLTDCARTALGCLGLLRALYRTLGLCLYDVVQCQHQSVCEQLVRTVSVGSYKCTATK